jgi:hypothetical protein
MSIESSAHSPPPLTSSVLTTTYYRQFEAYFRNYQSALISFMSRLNMTKQSHGRNLMALQRSTCWLTNRRPQRYMKKQRVVLVSSQPRFQGHRLHFSMTTSRSPRASQRPFVMPNIHRKCGTTSFRDQKKSPSGKNLGTLKHIRQSTENMLANLLENFLLKVKFRSWNTVLHLGPTMDANHH